MSKIYDVILLPVDCQVLDSENVVNKIFLLSESV